MYKFDSRVRYSEVDKDCTLTLEAILNYFQDCSSFHAEDIGLGITSLMEKKVVWVLSSWQIDVFRYPKFGERIIIGTLPYGFKGFIGYRNYIMESPDGKQLASANSVWTLMDIENQRPLKATEEIIRNYEVEEKIQMDYRPRKIVINSNKESMTQTEPIMIKTHHLDSNHHVNNGQYVKMAMDFLPEESKFHRMRAEYKKSAVLHDMLIPRVYDDDEVWQIVLGDEQNMPYAVVEFSKKKILHKREDNY